MTINYTIPDNLHRALKMQAAAEGVTLKHYITALLLAGARAVADEKDYPDAFRPVPE